MSLKKFKDLTLKGQKMRIVRDAITQIEMGNWTADPVTYLEFTGDLVDDLEYYEMQDKVIEENLDLQKVLKSGATCDVCAKGALFASCVLITNKVKGSDEFMEEDFQSHKLKKWFKQGELNAIEAAFEGRVVTDNNSKLENENYDLSVLGEKCLKFYKKYRNSPKKRMLAILKNILDNGEFTP